MKKILPCLLLNLLSLALFAQQTERQYLSGTDAKNTVEWDFYCTDGQNSGEWTKIAVPSNWELQGFGTYNYGHHWKNKDIKLGEEHGLYRHQFEVPKEWKGKTINIVFDGAMTDTQLKINGKSAGELHQGGFNRFKYDISKLLKYGGDNLLEVDVAKHSADASVNRAERRADFWIFGGIYRPVFLEVLPAQHMKRVAINAAVEGDIQVLVELNTKKLSGKVKVELFELKGEQVKGEFESDIQKGEQEVMVAGKFDGVRSWNPEEPNLYDMKITLISDTRAVHIEERRIGFRTVELRKKDGFYVNGKKVVFKGVNRHSFWPETGRALSEENHLMDIRLMKEMNMNAVRMSHYCPDERFLDLCDSLGLFVLDELAGWQQGYDTIIGPKRVKELILKDENHPSVVVWDHGNEGGWDFANEKWFHYYDIQKRPVIYPWLIRNGVDTHHYNAFDFGINRFASGNDVFMPTEVLHGLYDGGLGAGLDDFWNRFKSNPRLGGAFLWVFCDEAVLRTDLEGEVFDSNGNDAPDGILGPHREKEGSFYTIKDVWSPVQIEPLVINPKWNGELFVANEYIYSDLNTCNFSWQAVQTGLPGKAGTKILASGSFVGPNANPGETKKITVDLDESFKEADIFLLSVTDKNGMEILSRSWPVQHHATIVERLLKEIAPAVEQVKVEEVDGKLIALASGIEYSFDVENGMLLSVKNTRGVVSFKGGPTPVGLEGNELEKISWRSDADGKLIIEGSYNKYPKYFYWMLHSNGLLELEAAPNLVSANGVDYLGISFNYPESNVNTMQWMGNGPYRVWKNRTKGANFGVWEKEYNNTITGESFDNLIYPEFKGYHANTTWVRFNTTESPFTILVETPNIYMQVFKPGVPRLVRGGTMPPFPNGDISFLYEISAIGTKFKEADQFGPSSQKGIDRHHKGDDNDPIRLWFDFRTEN
jgi:hypothetical protein